MAFTWSEVVYGARLIEQLRTKLVFGQIAGRVQYIGTPTRGGSVQILTPSTISTGSTADGAISFTAVSGAASTITIGSYTTFDIELPLSSRQALSGEQEAMLVRNTLDEGAFAMAKDIDDSLAALKSSAELDLGTFSDAIDATNAMEVLGIVRDTLENAGALNRGGWVVFPSLFGSFLFEALSVKPQLMDGKVLSDGLLTHYMGLDIYTSPALTSTSDATPDEFEHTLFAGQYGSIAAAYGIDQLNYGPLWPSTRGRGMSGVVAYGVLAAKTDAMLAATITK